MRRDRELERELEELGSRIEYPPTPDVARAARRRLEEEGGQERMPRRGGVWFPAPSARWAAAAALLALLAVPIFSPAARETLSGPFVAGPTAEGGKPEVAAGESGDAASRLSAPETAEPIGAGLGFGEPVTLREARARAGDAAPVLLPEAAELGEPDAVYALGPPGEDGVVLVYRSRPGLPPLGDTGIGLVLTELTGDLGSTYLGGAGSMKGFEEVGVGGGRGYWIPDGRHLAPPDGRTWRPRVGVLLWEREGRALRLEADLPRKEAVRIAESTR